MLTVLGSGRLYKMCGSNLELANYLAMKRHRDGPERIYILACEK